MALITNLDTAKPAFNTRDTPVHATSIASFARDNNATLYTILDTVSASDTVAQAIEFPLCARENGGGGEILRATLWHADTDAAASFRLYVFDEEPTSLKDNEAFVIVAGDLEKLLGIYDFDSGSKTTVGTLLDLYDSVAGPHSFVCAESSTSLFGLLQCIEAYTPLTVAKMHIRLDLEQD